MLERSAARSKTTFCDLNTAHVLSEQQEAAKHPEESSARYRSQVAAVQALFIQLAFAQSYFAKSRSFVADVESIGDTGTYPEQQRALVVDFSATSSRYRLSRIAADFQAFDLTSVERPAEGRAIGGFDFMDDNHVFAL